MRRNSKKNPVNIIVKSFYVGDKAFEELLESILYRVIVERKNIT